MCGLRNKLEKCHEELVVFVNNNLCGKIVSILSAQIILDDNLKVTPTILLVVFLIFQVVNLIT